MADNKPFRVSTINPLWLIGPHLWETVSHLREVAQGRMPECGMYPFSEIRLRWSKTLFYPFESMHVERAITDRYKSRVALVALNPRARLEPLIRRKLRRSDHHGSRSIVRGKRRRNALIEVIDPDFVKHGLRALIRSHTSARVISPKPTAKRSKSRGRSQSSRSPGAHKKVSNLWLEV